VHQVQVDVVEPQTLRRRLERTPGVVLRGAVLNPELGGDEQLLARDSAGGDGPADRFLVAVGGGGVEVAVADLEGLGHGALGVLRRDRVDAEAEDGVTAGCDAG
jgi:hypothetical protein